MNRSAVSSPSPVISHSDSSRSLFSLNSRLVHCFALLVLICLLAWQPASVDAQWTNRANIRWTTGFTCGALETPNCTIFSGSFYAERGEQVVIHFNPRDAAWWGAWDVGVVIHGSGASFEQRRHNDQSRERIFFYGISESRTFRFSIDLPPKPAGTPPGTAEVVAEINTKGSGKGQNGGGTNQAEFTDHAKVGREMRAQLHNDHGILVSSSVDQVYGKHLDGWQTPRKVCQWSPWDIENMTVAAVCGYEAAVKVNGVPAKDVVDSVDVTGWVNSDYPATVCFGTIGSSANPLTIMVYDKSNDNGIFLRALPTWVSEYEGTCAQVPFVGTVILTSASACRSALNRSIDTAVGKLRDGELDKCRNKIAPPFTGSVQLSVNYPVKERSQWASIKKGLQEAENEEQRENAFFKSAEALTVTIICSALSTIPTAGIATATCIASGLNDIWNLLKANFGLWGGLLTFIDSIKSDVVTNCLIEIQPQVGLNLRSSPSTINAPMTTIPHGANVFALGRQGNWFKVNYNNPDTGESGEGWVHASYVKPHHTECG